MQEGRQPSLAIAPYYLFFPSAARQSTSPQEDLIISFQSSQPEYQISPSSRRMKWKPPLFQAPARTSLWCGRPFGVPDVVDDLGGNLSALPGVRLMTRISAPSGSVAPVRIQRLAGMLRHCQ
jgi:hypothetical protein